MITQQVGLSARALQSSLADALADIVSGLEPPAEFAADVLAEAEGAAAAVVLPDLDLTSVEFVTIDPPTSTDLDQAVHIERDGDGFTVRYAIADVPAFIRPGGALDAATRERGQTVYLPHRRVGLHPEAIAEDAGSLLPNRERGAYVWTFALDAAGAVVRTGLDRATVRSRAKLDYEGVQAALDAGEEDLPGGDTLPLLREIGPLRGALERQRGGASLRIPEQEIEVDASGRYVLVQRGGLPVEDWNAQISLMTGMEAARIMLEGRVGVLRTMPAPDDRRVQEFRRQAEALGHPWPEGQPYGEFLASLDVSDAEALALMHAATILFRGADYTAFDGDVPDDAVQAAIAAPYAHTTAPLRRLVDRFVLQTCWDLVHGEPVPESVRTALPELPELMRASGRRASAAERQAVDAVEAALLAERIGDEFDAIVIDDEGTVQIVDPAIMAKADGEASPGDRVRVRAAEADIAERRVRFEITGVPATSGDRS
ncbi:RNB domain-containing ribonuclease [Zhihengliuella sp.]|uniref:RNB domain-containing ribonuclease n=1 Tax=Zhihengliuella sp. TaxID=1954483 RepID=UPI0028110716|nr:RNB domain-containing ribonuclease [Zhihengliuella sp.]